MSRAKGHLCSYHAGGILNVMKSMNAPIQPDDTIVIRMATEADAEALRRLAELDSKPSLTGRVLVAEADGALRAATSLDDGRVVADPFVPSAGMAALLQTRSKLVRDPRPPRSSGVGRRLVRALSARPSRASA
jgi:hypothetical protein